MLWQYAVNEAKTRYGKEASPSDKQVDVGTDLGVSFFAAHRVYRARAVGSAAQCLFHSLLACGNPLRLSRFELCSEQVELCVSETALAHA